MIGRFITSLKSLALLFAAPFLLAGCGWQVISPYDPVVEERVTQLAYRTDEVLADGDKGRLSLSASRTFLKQSLCTVQALKARNLQTYRRTNEVATLEDLERRYNVLLARRKPLRTSVAAELRAALWDFRYFQCRKHAIEEWADANASNITTNDTSTDNCSTQSKGCDAHNSGGGHGSGGDHSSGGGGHR